MSDKLTLVEMSDLKKLEKVIDHVTTAANSGWDALREIRDRKLYRAVYKSFDEYCEEKWNMSGRRGRQLTDMSSMVLALTDKSGTTVPVLNEGTARELKAVPEEDRAEVLEVAKNNPKGVTSTSVKEAAKEVEQAKKVQLDRTGYPIPEPLLELWNRGSEPEEMMHALNKVRGVMQKSATDSLYAEVNIDRINSAIGEVTTTLKRAVPYSVCTQCQGRVEVQPKGKCPLCKGRGLISEFLFKTCVPSEVKNIRANATKRLSKSV